MIAFLVGSTMWQYQQFQTNVKNLQFGLPQELTNMPNANDQLSQMMGQIQGQLQNQTQNQQNSAAANDSAATSTKTYTAPDSSFSFDYPSDWQEIANQAEISNNNGKLFFSAQKINILSSASIAINYLTVEESYSTSTEAIIEQYKKNIQEKGVAAKITQSELIKGEQIIPTIEIKYDLVELSPNIATNLILKSAIITNGNNIYIITTILQNSDSLILQEVDKIMESISLATTERPIEKR